MLENWAGIELEKEFQIQDGKEMASNFNSVVWMSLEFPVGIRGW
jgi:hypothetical protein